MVIQSLLDHIITDKDGRSCCNLCLLDEGLIENEGYQSSLNYFSVMGTTASI